MENRPLTVEQTLLRNRRQGHWGLLGTLLFVVVAAAVTVQLPASAAGWIMVPVAWIAVALWMYFGFKSIAAALSMRSQGSHQGNRE